MLAAVALFFLYLTIERPAIWVPLESVTTTDRGTFIAYVVAEEGGWTTMLTPRWLDRPRPGPGSVFREQTDHITARQTCSLDIYDAQTFSRALRIRAYQVITVVRQGKLPPALTPPCP